MWHGDMFIVLLLRKEAGVDMDLVALSLSTTTAQSGRSIAVLQRNKCKM
jgi:hypothetical protein